jgi:hypothetical protein
MRKLLCLGVAVAAGFLLSWSAPAVEFQATDVRVDKGSGTVSSGDVSLATNGSGAIYAGWLDYRNDVDQVFFNRSADYGQTWGGSDVQFSTQTSQNLMVISGGGSRVYAIWAEYLGAARNIMFRYSSDYGSSWAATQQVNTTTDGKMELCKIACDGGNNVYAVWKRYASGNNGILFRRSTDGGVNWEGVDSEFSYGTVDYPSMVADTAGNIYVAWQMWDDDDIYLKYSTDYGEGWSTQTKLNNATGGTQEYISLGYSGNNVYALWKDGWFPHTVRFDRSTNNGQTWGNPDTFLNQTDGSYYISRPYMANGSNGEIYAIWTNSRDTYGNVRNIYFNASGDYGEGWQPSEVRMTTFSSDYGKVIAGSSGQVYAVYEDTQVMDTLYCQASSDTGATWDSRIKVSTESPNDGTQRYFGLATDDRNLYVAWRESRTDVYGVWFNYAQIGAAESPTYRISSGDYNGDGTSDIGVFRPSQGLWSIRNVTRVYLGNSTDYPVSADYNGDGTSDIAIFRGSEGLWSVRGLTRAYLGNSTDALVPGDYNGTGTAQAAIFRPSTGMWSVRNLTRFYFGASTDEVVPGPYNGVYSQAAIFRPSGGMWSVRDLTRFYMGASTDLPVPGDYDLASGWEGAVYRPSSGMWSVRNVTRAYFGGSDDYPLPAKYSGTATDDIGIFRASSGMWSVRNLTRVYFGAAGDMPVTR